MMPAQHIKSSACHNFGANHVFIIVVQGHTTPTRLIYGVPFNTPHIPVFPNSCHSHCLYSASMRRPLPGMPMVLAAWPVHDMGLAAPLFVLCCCACTSCLSSYSLSCWKVRHQHLHSWSAPVQSEPHPTLLTRNTCTSVKPCVCYPTTGRADTLECRTCGMASPKPTHRGCCRSIIKAAGGVGRAGSRSANAHGDAKAARERQGADPLLREVAAAGAQAIAGVHIRLTFQVGRPGRR